ncbi:MAG: hypothetical protein ACOVQ0_06625 [Novosphingobium sp.]|uniref:hypothetical protein n=1 Tax=Novosphingobium sp. TaxID=1874826 RepID=UPI003B9A3648
MNGFKTLREAGDLIGLSAHAVRMKAKRAGWTMSRDNAGRLLVLLPDDLEREGRTREPVKASPPLSEKGSEKGSREDLTAALATVAELRNQVDQLTNILASDRADRAAERTAWTVALTAAAAEASAARLEVDRLRARGLVSRLLNQ